MTQSGRGPKKYDAVQQGLERGTDYGTSGLTAVSLRFDVGRPDHLAPLFGFFGGELS
jgi:hypothetical protein